MEKYEEYKTTSAFWGWVIVLGLYALILGWGFFLHMTVPQTPREWDFGALPDTPAQSVVTTEVPPPAATAPRQMEPLPGSQPPENPEKRHPGPQLHETIGGNT